MAIVKLTQDNFKTTLDSNEIVLIDFYATWCAPCRMLGEVLEDLSVDHPELIIGKVNVDEEGELAQAFSIRSIPQIFICKNGKVVKNISGYVGANVILEAVKEC